MTAARLALVNALNAFHRGDKHALEWELDRYIASTTDRVETMTLNDWELAALLECAVSTLNDPKLDDIPDDYQEA